MTIKFFLLILFIHFTGHVFGVDRGFRISIKRVPFMVYGYVVFDKKRPWNFCGVIVDQNKVLVPWDVCRTEKYDMYTDHWVAVGVSNLLHNNETTPKYKIRNKIFGKDNLCMFRVDRDFPMGERIQRAVFPEPGSKPPGPFGTRVIVVGFGPALAKHHTHELSYTNAYLKQWFDIKAYQMFLAGTPDLKGKFHVDWSESGAAVLDPDTMVVIGLIWSRWDKLYFQMPMYVLQGYDDFIEDTRKKLDAM